MRVYDVYVNPMVGFEAVKHGFCWPACFFTWIWAFVKKLWFVGTFFLVITFGFVFVDAILEKGQMDGLRLVSAFVKIVLMIFAGFMGNAWRGKRLLLQGYLQVATVPAATRTEAISKIKAETAESMAVSQQ